MYIGFFISNQTRSTTLQRFIGCQYSSYLFFYIPWVTIHVYLLFITVFTVFRWLTDFVCLYDYEFWLSLCKIVRSSVILLLPLFMLFKKKYAKDSIFKTILKNFYHSNQTYKYNATDKVWENLLIEPAFKHCICK